MTLIQKGTKAFPKPCVLLHLTFCYRTQKNIENIIFKN